MINTKNRKMILLNLYSYDEENKSDKRLQGGVVRTILSTASSPLTRKPPRKKSKRSTSLSKHPVLMMLATAISSISKAGSLTWYWRLSAKRSTWIISLITTIKNQMTMKKYIGTKTIMAKPMAKSEAEKVLNRSLADAKGGENGYLIEYPDGYKSWSPKETFEEAYKVADTYLDRMRIEYADVKERVLKLHTFLMSEEFRDMPKEKKNKLQAQCGAMSAYVEILGQRIDEAKMEQKQQEAAQAAAAAQKMRESLVGLTIVEAGKCDFCPSETTDCKKLILADGSHICVKDMSKQPSKAQ